MTSYQFSFFKQRSAATEASDCLARDHRLLHFTDKEGPWGDEDFTFGAYQPTVGSCEGRQSRRQSVR